MSDQVSRRAFVTSAAIGAPALLNAQNSGNRLKAAWIGTGSRGNHVMNMAYGGSAELMEVVAVCDTYAGNLTRAKDNVQSKGKNTPKTYADYKELLADPSIDVVFISTPEHLHYPMFMAAIKAGP